MLLAAWATWIAVGVPLLLRARTVLLKDEPIATAAGYRLGACLGAWTGIGIGLLILSLVSW